MAKSWKTPLHGTWLHEPLHAILTDVPVGAWTATIAFDALGTVAGTEAFNTAADGTLALGLLGAIGAGVTGMTDWSRIEQAAPRRIGAVHGILNVLATGLFVGSCVARAKSSAHGQGPGCAGLRGGFCVRAPGRQPGV